MRIAHRIQQLASALRAQVRPEERALVATLLTPAERRLFELMPLFDQRHSLDVYHTLVQMGRHETPLLKAALLHDVGKVDDDGRPIPLLLYGLFVVLNRVAPGVYKRAARDGRGQLRVFAVHADHDNRSVRMVRAASDDAETLRVLDDYAARRTTPLTVALAWADNQN